MPRKSKADQEGTTFETEDYYLFAAELVHRYLGDRNYFVGGPIPKSRLLSLESIQIVLRTDFDSGIQFVHDHCISKLKPDPNYSDPSVPWEVHHLLGMLYELGDLGIPKRFRGGLLMLYFKFCKGFSIPDPPEVDSIMEEWNETLD